MSCSEAQFLVTNTIPSNGAKNIACNANVEFLANQSLRGSTVTSNRFYLYSGTKGRYPGAITFNTATNRVTLNPAQDFFPGGQVFAQMTDGILNSGGAGGMQSYTWSFYAAAEGGDVPGQLNDTDQRLGSGPFLTSAIGDFDNDGDLDAIAAIYESNQASYEVYQNNGTGRFARIQRMDCPTFNVPRNATCGDIDNDGDLDAVFAVQSGCWVFLNDGTGQFTHGASDFGDNISRAVALGDMNGDGTLDAVVANYNQNDEVWTNRNGTFYLAQSFNGTARSLFVRLADVNNNGTLDAVISAYSVGHTVFTSDYYGVLSEYMKFSPTNYISASLALGDLNGDGSIDAFCGGANDYWQVWTNNSTGSFTLKSAFSEKDWAFSTELGDMNGDGNLDVILLSSLSGLQIWTNNGTGAFENSGMPTNNIDGVEIANANLGDLDGDGDLDVFMAYGSNCWVYLNELPSLAVLGTNGATIVNGELASVTKGTDFGSVVLGHSDSRTLSLTDPSAVAVTITSLATNGTGVAMFSVEGMADVVAPDVPTNFYIRFTPTSPGVHTAAVSIVHDGTNSPSWFYISGTGTQPLVTNTTPANGAFNQDCSVRPSAQFTQPMNGATLTSNRFFVYSAQSGFKRGPIAFDATTNTATLDPSADLRPGELVHAEISRGVMNQLNNAELVHHTWSFYTDVQTGPALFGDSGQRIGTNETQSAALGDLNGDGWLDVFLVNSDQACEVWTNNRAGVFFRVPMDIGTTNSRYVALGDINNDGDLDAVVVRDGLAAQVFNNLGNAVFSESGQTLSTGNGSHATLTDFNGDGALDILLLRDGETGSVWINTGPGIFGLYAATPSAAVMAGGVIDVNGDGFLDAFIAVDGSGNQVLTNNGAGTLTASAQLPGSGNSRDVAMGDFNGDGFFDAFVANGNGQANAVWFNSGTGIFYNSGQSLGTANSRGVAAGDFDGDGDLDVFVANYGEPNEIWMNDGSGVFSDSGHQLGNEDSCRVQVGDVDGDGRLDAFVANENSSCTLWLNTRPDIAVVGTNGVVIPNGAVATEAAGTDFGTMEISQSATHHLSITNPGLLDLVIESTSISQPYFSVEEAPVLISIGTASNLVVKFEPHVAGLSEASLSIVSTATNSPYQVNLRGTATVSFQVTNVEPSGVTAIAADTVTAIAYLSEAASTETLTTNRFLMYGKGNGYHDRTLSFSDGNRRAQLDSDDPFFAGEEITAWFTSGILNSSGLNELSPYAWSYRKAVPGGSAHFRNSDQVLITKTNSTAALGDLDGDGDLDVIAGGWAGSVDTCAVWRNDGSGNLTKGFEFIGPKYVYGVALGDLDRDGDLDVMFAQGSYMYSTYAVWMNDGSGSFSNSGFSYGTYGSADVALQDLNADGYLDAFSVSVTGNRVWLNEEGALVDSGQNLYPGSGSPNKVGLADLDGDGDIDAYECKGNGDCVWLNRGDGFFVNGGGHTNQDIFLASRGLALGDVDGDGDIDAYTMTTTNAILWLNNGEAVFTNSGQIFECNFLGSDAAIGDLDGDADLDLFCTHRYYNSVLVNDGMGVFTEQTPVMISSNYSVCLGDMDGDGDLDAYTTSVKYNRDNVWINENPDFTIRGMNGVVITNGETTSIAKGTDFGVVSNGISVTHVLSITNSGPGTLMITAVITNGASGDHFHIDMPMHIQEGTVSNITVVFAPQSLFWGTQKVDLVIENLANSNKQMILYLEGYGVPPRVTNTMPPNAACSVGRATNITAQFSEPMLAGTLTSNTFVLHGSQSGLRRGVVSLNPEAKTAVLYPSASFRPGELVFGSLPNSITNKPGRAPLSPFAWSFYVAAGNAPGAFRTTGQSLGAAPTRSVALGDLDGDGDLDALAGNNGQASRVWFGNGAGIFTQGVQALTSAYTYDIALGDLDMDGDIDFFQVNYNQADRVWLNNGDGTFTDSGQDLGSSRSQTVTLGDVDGDGDLDAFVGNWVQPAQLWLNDGHAGFTASSQTLESEMCTAAAFADLNQDGFLDVFLGTVIGNRVWTNNGFGVFSDSGQDLGNAVTYGIALGDVDSDGDFDAYAANSGEPHILWLNDGHGVFSDSGQPLSTTFANQAAFGDVNGDGDLDIVLANDWQQPAEVWTNSGAGLFYNSGQRLGNKSRYSVALGDVDGDGDMDAFFGNNGSCDVWLNDIVFYTLTGMAEDHGSITPEGPVTVIAGGSTSFVVYADTYYWIDAMTVAGSARVEAVHLKGFTCLCESVYCDGTAVVSFAEACAAHGTPELWLVQYGWTSNFDYWELQDTDGDAFQAWEEQVAGTDPTNAASYLQLTGCESLGNGKMLDWNGVSGRVYSILVNTNLLGVGPWSSITSNLPPTGTWTDTTDHAEADLFYRLGVEQAPKQE